MRGVIVGSSAPFEPEGPVFADGIRVPLVLRKIRR